MQGPRFQSILCPSHHMSLLPMSFKSHIFRPGVKPVEQTRLVKVCYVPSSVYKLSFGFFIYKMGINNRSDLIGLLGKSNEITYVKSFTQSLVHSKCLISIRHSICDTQNSERAGLTVSLQAWVLASNLPPTHRLTLGHCFLFVSLFPNRK